MSPPAPSPIHPPPPPPHPIHPPPLGIHGVPHEHPLSGPGERGLPVGAAGLRGCGGAEGQVPQDTIWGGKVKYVVDERNRNIYFSVDLFNIFRPRICTLKRLNE